MAGKQFTLKEVTDRFWSRVNKSDGCWLWTSSLHPQGYGILHNIVFGTRRAHRIAWMLTHGDIQHDQFVCRPRAANLPIPSAQRS